jgi:hypothetical protein
MLITCIKITNTIRVCFVKTELCKHKSCVLGTEKYSDGPSFFDK